MCSRSSYDSVSVRMIDKVSIFLFSGNMNIFAKMIHFPNNWIATKSCLICVQFLIYILYESKYYH